LGGITVDAALKEFIVEKFQKAGVGDFMEGNDLLLGVDPNPPDGLFFSSGHGVIPPFGGTGLILCDFGIKSNMQFSHKLK
jgi:hypothetical protein